MHSEASAAPRRRFLGATIADVRRGCGPRTMRATEEPSADLDAMPNDPALAMFTDRRQGLNRAFKTVKGVAHAGRYQFEGFVVFIAANFTLRHLPPQTGRRS